MGVCKFCKKDMSNAHSNKKFCSNKGSQNCKDLYNNRTPERIDRAKHYSGHNERVLAAQYDSNSIGDDDQGWDAHKDSW
jgi:hypothetical protein